MADNSMRAMILKQPGEPLMLKNVGLPAITSDQVLIKVNACGICRTDLHVVDGDLKKPKLPVIPGHQIIGVIEKMKGGYQGRFRLGQRVGVPWLGGSCGRCDFCSGGQENLCSQAVYTGYQLDGGFAEYVAADQRYCFPIPDGFDDQQAAPLLCAGLIGYRAYCRVKSARQIGFYGFGAAAHILIQLASYNHQQIYAFTRTGDVEAQEFAIRLGAVWAGDSTRLAPQPLDAAIIFAPDGNCLPQALKQVRKGGRVVCAGIHMSDIPSFPYELLWGERSIESIANLTRADAEEFLPLAAKIPIKTEVHAYQLEQANEALDDLRGGRFTGAAVLLL